MALIARVVPLAALEAWDALAKVLEASLWNSGRPGHHEECTADCEGPGTGSYSDECVCDELRLRDVSAAYAEYRKAMQRIKVEVDAPLPTYAAPVAELDGIPS